jgi:hypothetical protein
MKIFGIIKTLIVIGASIFAINFAWHLFTDAPSTASVCYTWSKATDLSLPFDENGIDGAQWLADNIKTEEDLENLDPDVLSAMRLYDTGSFLEDVDNGERMGLRQFVIDACEKAAPGSTDH